jgi:hypothetical protein
VNQGITQLKPNRNHRSMAEERAGRKLGALRVLNSYWVNQVGGRCTADFQCHCLSSSPGPGTISNSRLRQQQMHSLATDCMQLSRQGAVLLHALLCQPQAYLLDPMCACAWLSVDAPVFSLIVFSGYL